MTWFTTGRAVLAGWAILLLLIVIGATILV